MDGTLEAKAWRRGFAAGFLALALSVGGQVAASRSEADAPSCPYAARESSLAAQVFEHLQPAIRARGGVAQRVALLVLGAMLQGRCS